MMELPDREVVLEQLDLMIERWTSHQGARSDSEARSRYQPEPKPPAVYAISLVGHDELCLLDSAGTNRALVEITRRLDRLVRSEDLLGQLSPGLFVLAAAAVAPSMAGVIMERLTGAVAMPVEINGQTVSLSVGIGLAFAFDGASSTAMLEAAEVDMNRRGSS